MKKKLLKIAIACAIVLAVAGLVFVGIKIVKSLGKTYNSYKVKSEVEVAGNSAASFAIGDSWVLRYTRDGVSAFNESGKEIWNVAYEMNSPIVDINGKYAAVADRGSETLYIMDGTGSVHTVATEHPIEQISVADLGITAVWMDGGVKDYITIYKIDGNKITDMMTTTGEDGIPLAMDMSKDGTKLVTSYVAFNDGQAENRLSFYNFGEYGASYVDRLVGFKSFVDRTIADVRFVDSEHVVAFSTKGANIFYVDVKEDEVATIDIEERIEQVSANGEYIGIVTSGDTGARTVTIYDFEGRKKESQKLEANYRHFELKKKEMIFYNNNELYIKRIGGSDKAKITLNTDVNGVFTENGSKTYLIIGEHSMQRIELTVEDDK